MLEGLLGVLTGLVICFLPILVITFVCSKREKKQDTIKKEAQAVRQYEYQVKKAWNEMLDAMRRN
jgi:hypothetical protein